ncbi:methyltransferase family protein [Peptostreptococcus canis]|uniref:Isoprenylcysteine carboxylmethyltransferase family protein n=1 Tax=Peptostreptococcus canis TaxID=1159213 RepID=A0ABR6TMQ9_9FIRM|nr:isoprenylcysteine carboxylmethyltransferase family protein [Peptostreptococcus canis]MBC2576704.1 isoprenylcysteine carboxylmethyltransferase family protein [Peptostreptococcus canis]MBP1998447.1 protein-S-isoprenylcysteine O-methyltransferase Ste14 [Peptostreptococcus canis]
MNNKEHLPIMGIGPLIVIPQLLITTIAIIISRKGFFGFAKLNMTKLPFMIVGILLIISGVIIWCFANFKTRIDKYIKENKLATTGIYSIVRNPIYSSFLLICTGFIMVENNMILFLIPIICWIYMTLILKNTEEKWLQNLYGSEYIDYCKRVNRCIPWFPK